MPVIHAADLFCGAGGTSTGLLEACKELGLKLKLVAINHWQLAIETHSANHPWADHLCESLDNVDPRKVVPRGHLHLLWASPECTHHSIARGGRPINDQSRATAWHVLRWAEALRIHNILIENVKEFQTWGPLGINGRPLKIRKGETYQAFLQALRSLGYQVEARVLNAADYGDPTTRERLFIQARRGRRLIRWPEPTHTPDGRQTLWGETQRWRPARDIIDWSIKGESIFNRKRPLAPATMERIAYGLKKFGWPEPFLLVLRNHMDGRSLDEPVPTLAAAGQHIGLVEPFIVPMEHGKDNRRVCSIDQPFLIKYYGCGENVSSVAEPLDTVTTKERFGLVEPASFDILFRMLQPHELAAAMSFPREYKFAGRKADQVKQIGNAVPVRTATALCKTLLEDIA